MIFPFVSVEIIVFPLKFKLSTLKLSILLLASTTRALLAVRVPAVWSSISTYTLPPIASISPVVPPGRPIKSLLLLAEYASSPLAREVGDAVVVLLFIFIVAVI